MLSRQEGSSIMENEGLPYYWCVFRKPFAVVFQYEYLSLKVCYNVSTGK